MTKIKNKKRNGTHEKGEVHYSKGDVFAVRIEDIGNDGEGIGKVDGYTLFIKDAVIGDLVKVSIMKSKKNYAYAHLDEIIEASPDRVEPPCPVARACGGCQIQNLSYEKQLEFKAGKVKNNLIRIGGFDEKFIDERFEQIIGMTELESDDDKKAGLSSHFRYRNKAQFPIGTGKDGQPIAGFYAGRTHAIIPVADCLLGVEENRVILEAVLTHMKKYHIEAYDERTGEGVFRHVLIRKGFHSGEIMICLVINSDSGSGSYKETKKKSNTSDGKKKTHQKAASVNEQKNEFFVEQEELVKSLSSIEGVKSITVNINNERTNVILGKEIYTIYGSDSINDTLCGIEFSISPLSFYQVNPVQTEKLYTTAIEYAGFTGKETVWDLYCGIGTISLSMAKKAKQVYGVEVIPQAIDNAKDNAKQNGINNATFYVGKAEEVLPDFYSSELEKSHSTQNRSDVVDQDTFKSKGGTRVYNEVASGNCIGANNKSEYDSRNEAALHPDVIVVDPPRKGCDSACLETMIKMAPQRIVYVSCDSATLARDLRVLTDGGYEIKHIRPVDMFPNTVHVETVVLLTKTTA